ncbi:hypothetical protein BsWGS_09974 [Bradybaena similaris]
MINNGQLSTKLIHRVLCQPVTLYEFLRAGKGYPLLHHHSFSKLLPLAATSPENGMHYVMFIVTCYIRAFCRDTSDSAGQHSQTHYLSGTANALQIPLPCPLQTCPHCKLNPGCP